MAALLVGAILSSGFRYDTAMTLADKILPALRRGGSISHLFANKRKIRAINSVWRERERRFGELRDVTSEREAFHWCEKMPYIRGPVLRYQAVRDLGLADVAKPDRLMQRLADRSGESVQELCSRLSRESGDRKGTVDVVLWYAASKEIIPGIRLVGRRPFCHALPIK